MDVKKLEVTKKLIAGLLLTATAASLAACGKKSDCEINGYHLHRYEKYGIARYLSEEELEWRGYDWTDQIEYVTPSEQQLREFEQRKGLIRIDDNVDYLMQLEQELQDFTEYRYKYTKLKTQLVGKIVVTVPKPAYSWTKDGGHACLTGETRRCHHVYTGYKVVEDNGRFKIIESEPSDSLVAIKDEFPYFKEKCYKVVVLGDNKEADYEDGPEIKEPDEELEKLINNK